MSASLQMQQLSSSFFCSVIGAEMNMGCFVVAKTPEAEVKNEEPVCHIMGTDPIQR